MFNLKGFFFSYQSIQKAWTEKKKGVWLERGKAGWS